MSDTAETTSFDAHCSFCRKAAADVETLIGGIGVFICDECVDVANDALAKTRAARDPAAPKPRFDYSQALRGATTEKLLRLVAGVEPLRCDVSAYQALNVDILRERGVSWAEIGASLGVSRQAAWKRFAKGPETD